MTMQINYIEVLINILLASFGGLVRRMAEIEKNPGKKATVSYYVVGSAISMFVGIVVYILCQNFGVSALLTAGATALAGYMGTPVLDMLSDIAKNKLGKGGGTQ
jgi:CheY-specific phosphatase CheX